MWTGWLLAIVDVKLRQLLYAVFLKQHLNSVVFDSNFTDQVLAVGYGVEDGVPYWLIKNSWGAACSDDGYFKMELGKNMWYCYMRIVPCRRIIHLKTEWWTHLLMQYPTESV